MTSSEAFFADDDYDSQLGGSRRSAAVVAPLVMNLLAPQSIVDFGAGAGAWLAAFRDLGAKDILGLEGGLPNDAQLHVPRHLIQQHDLSEPIFLRRRFDLALSLEVAEHLPDDAAKTFVANITQHADAVLFSAAIPNQGGHGHINERWPLYWAEEFAALDYQCFDPFRWRIWDDDRVEWWYRQNLLVFATGGTAEALRAAGHKSEWPRPLVRAELYEHTVAQLNALRGTGLHSA